MRRKEFEVTEHQEIEAFLQEMSFGFLGTHGTSGRVHITPLNFVYHQGTVYFHGSRIGQKMKDLAENNQVTFSVAKEYAILPSYFSDPKLACPASAFFKSVVIYGNAKLVEDDQEKAEAFTAFMQKLQPEGGYEPITPEDEDYKKQLKAVALVKIIVEEITAKFKFGQNLNETRAEKIESGLTERGKELDLEAVELMKKYCPAHRSQS